MRDGASEGYALRMTVGWVVGSWDGNSDRVIEGVRDGYKDGKGLDDGTWEVINDGKLEGVDCGALDRLIDGEVGFLLAILLGRKLGKIDGISEEEIDLSLLFFVLLPLLCFEKVTFELFDFVSFDDFVGNGTLLLLVFCTFDFLIFRDFALFTIRDSSRDELDETKVERVTSENRDTNINPDFIFQIYYWLFKKRNLCRVPATDAIFSRTFS